jgi:hypothetical protein
MSSNRLIGTGSLVAGVARGEHAPDAELLLAGQQLCLEPVALHEGAPSRMRCVIKLTCRDAGLPASP